MLEVAMAPTSVHTRILVTDYRRSFLFYRDTLGLSVTFGDESSGYADFQIGDAGIALFDRHEMIDAIGASDETASAGSDRFALVLGVDDVDRVAEELKGKGIELVTAPADHPD